MTNVGTLPDTDDILLAQAANIAMSGPNITYPSRQAARQIRGLVENLATRLKEIKEEPPKLHLTWIQSDVSTRRARKVVYRHELFLGNLPFPVADIEQAPHSFKVTISAIPGLFDLSYKKTLEEAKQYAEERTKAWFASLTSPPQYEVP